MNHAFSAATLVAISLFLSPGPRAQAAPANDSFDNRILLRGLTVAASGDNLGATAEPGDPAPVGPARRPATVWWSWLAPATGPAFVNTSNSWRFVNGAPSTSPLDTVLAVYTGDALTHLSLVASNDDAIGSWSQAQFIAQAGATYQILVAGYNTQATGSIALCVSGPAPSGPPQPPAVTLLAPLPGAQVVPGTNLPLVVEAYDADGAISKVEFYRNNYKIGAATAHPYSLVWSNVPAGAWALTAVAVDLTGLSATSAVASILAADPLASSVVLTQPLDGARWVQTASQALSAILLPPLPVPEVIFLANGLSIGRAATAPYEMMWSGAAPGAYELRAVAAGVTSSPVRVTLVADQPPVVSLTLPATGTEYVAPVAFNFVAEASDLDGIVTRVDFCANGQKVAEASSSPWTATWSNVPVSAYSLTAVAWDNAGHSTTSAATSVAVRPNQPPLVSLVQVTNGAHYIIPADITMTALAEDADGTVTNVEFWAGPVKLADVPAAPYTYTWADAEAGAYWLMAVAVDDTGLRSLSDLVRITVGPNQPPQVSLLSPADGARSTPAETVHLTAAASDPDGWITRIEFLTNGVKFAEGFSGVTSIPWDQAPPGVYSITAVAADSGGILVTSAPAVVTISVPPTPWGGLAFNGTNQYVAFGAAPALGLRTFTLELWFKWTGGGVPATTGGGGLSAIPLIAKLQGEFDGDIRDGNYFLGIRPADGLLVADLEEGADAASPGLNHPVAGATPVTTNVWHHAAATFDGARWQLFLDGRLEATLAVGQPVRWDSLQHLGLGTALDSTGAPHGAFAGVLDEVRVWDHARDAAEILAARDIPLTEAPGLASRWALDETNGLSAPNSVPGAPSGQLVNGPVWAIGRYYAGPPVVRLLNPVDGDLFYTPAPVEFQAQALDYDGSVARVEFYAGTLKLGERLAAPYEFTWTNPPAGTHRVTALAIDDSGMISRSEAARIRIESPLIQFLQPEDGQRFVAPIDLAIKAAVPDESGAITVVEIFADGASLGRLKSPPYSVVWNQAPLGTHVLTAVATDIDGVQTAAAPVEITLVPMTPPSVFLLSPTNGTHLVEPGALEIVAHASDPEGTVSRVEFFVNGAKLREVVTPPYSVLWSQPPPGLYDLTVVATDNFDLSSTSAVVSIQIAANQPPSIALASPANGARFMLGTSITLSAAASDPDGAVSLVEFFVNGVKLGATNAPPYRIVWSAPPIGSYDLTAVATDDRGAVAASAVTTVSVATNSPPRVALASPGDNTYFAPQDVVRFSATASDPDGSIARVEFYLNGARVAAVTRSPYAYDWVAALNGSYSLAAVAFDNGGLSATSAPVRFLVQTPDVSGSTNTGGWTAPVVEHVVHISLDGMGGAYLARYLASAPASFPTFKRLQTEGASTLNARCDVTYSITLPNHASMFTGRPVDQPPGWANTTQHGVHTDSDSPTKTIHDPSVGNPNVPYKASVFDVAHDNGLSTAFYYTKASLKIFVRSWDSAHGAASPFGANKIDFNFSSYGANSYGPTAPVVDEFVNQVQASALKNYTFVHFDDPDSTGHSSGWGSAAWSNAAIRVDQQLGRILDAIKSSPYASQTAVMVTADHGGGGKSAKGHGEPSYYTNYVIPFFLWGQGIPAGTNLYSLFSNRADPGDAQPAYPADPQPIRTADCGNMALALLGLSPIPGSSILPAFVTRPPGLTITRSGANITVSWPASAAGYELQSAAGLGRSAVWQSVTTGISSSSGVKWITTTPSPLAPARFYRLKKP